MFGMCLFLISPGRETQDPHSIAVRIRSMWCPPGTGSCETRFCETGFCEMVYRSSAFSEIGFCELIFCETGFCKMGF